MWAIFTKGHPDHPYPLEYVDFCERRMLCDMYHCSPTELGQLDAQMVENDLKMLNAEERAKLKPVRRL
jgi:hypothetical protein